jgi:hypothetical protein
MSDIAKKVVSFIGLLGSAILTIILRKVFEVWGIFDPFSEWLGGWLKMHITSTQVEWTIAGAIAVAAYAALLFLVWRRHHIQPIADVAQPHPEAPAQKEIDLHQFLRFVGIDPIDPMSRVPPMQNKANAAFVKLRQLARDGNIRLRGKPGFKYGSAHMSWKPTELIEPSYWRDAQIFCLDVLGKKDVSNISTMPDDAMRGGKSEADVYKGITIIEGDVNANFKKDESNGGAR